MIMLAHICPLSNARQLLCALLVHIEMADYFSPTSPLRHLQSHLSGAATHTGMSQPGIGL